MDGVREFGNKVVLVTGSSSGIGESVAVLFAKLGAKVVVTGRNERKINEVIEKCKQASGNDEKGQILGVTGDVGKEADIRRIVDKTVEAFGQIDVLVNNAGIGLSATIDDPKAMQVFDNLMNTNLRPIVLFCHLVVPFLVKTKGSIINISSVAANKPHVGFMSYGVMKAALDMVTKSLALELGPQGIRVNGINPGAIKTNFMTRMGAHDDNSYLWEGYSQLSPLGLVGLPQDVAHMVTFLASDKAAFITGANYIVDGGYSVQSVAK